MFAFLKKILTSCLGIVVGMLVSLLLLVLLIVGLGTLLLFDQKNRVSSVVENTYLHLKLDGVVVERNNELPIDLFRTEAKKVGLDDLRKVIAGAALDSKITGIYLEIGNLSVAPAGADEIRQALEQFQKSGKTIVAYSGAYTQNGYYVASVADVVCLNPQGMINLKGLSAERMFYKGTLEKLGVNMQIFRVGNYKSAVEPYTETEMSLSSRSQTQEYLNEIWNYQIEKVARSRNLPVDSLERLVEKGLLFQEAQLYKAAHLVDTLVYESEVMAFLKDRQGISQDKKLNLIKVDDLAAMLNYRKADDEIAILYAEGEIVGESMGEVSSEEIVEKRICKEIEKLRNNKRVKAVVLRVNSPGGSAYSSEQIWKALCELNREKTLVVSMGSYAASGGYYIASAASYIVASPLTITGSIGIFGMIPDVSGVTRKVGLTFDGVKTHRFADFPSITRPMDEAEKDMMQQYVNRGYDIFLKRCLEGRKNMTYEQLDSVAQGRVWTGMHASKIGLVDELGDLNMAVLRAASLSNVHDYMLKAYPPKKDWIDRLIDEKFDLDVLSLWREQKRLYNFMRGREVLMPLTDYLQAVLPERVQAD